jgi:hypothetical protein
MSLESSIELLAQAINNLAAAQTMNSISAPKVQVTTAEVMAERDASQSTVADAKKKVTEKKLKETEAPTTDESSPASVPTTESSSPEPSYEDVRKQILAIAGKSRDKVVALLSRYGAKNGQELKPEQYAKFIADGERVLSGDYDPEKGE